MDKPQKGNEKDKNSKKAVQGKTSVSLGRLEQKLENNSSTKHKEQNQNEIIDKLKKEVEFDEHLISIEELCGRYQTSVVKGISKLEAKTRLLTNGKNALTPPKKKSEIVRFLKSITQGFSILLWIGAILCFLVFIIELLQHDNDEVNYDQVYLGSVLIIVVLVTGIFSFYQEGQSSKLIESFKNMIPLNTEVIREGRIDVIKSELLVVGDLVLVKTGDRIPADIRITECTSFKVDNSPLTGESDPQSRTVDNTNQDPLHAKNLVFFSTNAVEGSARGIVFRTGDNTMMGHIAGLTTTMTEGETTIAREIKYFMKLISLWACFLGITFFIASMLKGNDWLESAMFLIGIITANVPEGLLATVTVCLTLTSKRMAAKNCLVKNLEAVETLGSTSVICSDKTGTLTQNKMTVTHLYYDDKIVEVLQGGHITKREKDTLGYKTLIRCAILCNKAEFKPDQENVQIMRREVIGDASEAAILKCMEITTRNKVSFYRMNNPKVLEIPFNSKDKFQVSIHLSMKKQYILVMKGAFERVLERCSTVLWGDQVVQLSENIKETILHSCMELAGWGERILGMCDLELSIKDFPPPNFNFSAEKHNFPLKDLRFVGLITMIDPPRANVPEAVLKCRSAGIKIIMVTGDHPATAKSIAKQVGIIAEASRTVEDLVEERQCKVEDVPEDDITAIVVDGSQLKKMTKTMLDNTIKKFDNIVFARTSPIQKLLIVESCQRSGAIVAVTGDGVNDSPALKRADIGIAMGISGSDVSKQAADMILLDDNFSTIVTGVEEGRLIFDNLKKSIAYTLASNIPEITPFVAYVLLDIPLPLGVIAILCIDLGTDMIPAVSLAYETAESDIMSRPPRNAQEDRLVNSKLLFQAYGQIGMIEAAAGFYSYIVVMAENGFKPYDLLGLRGSWDSKDAKYVVDSYGQKWSFDERKTLELTCHTAFFVAIVIAQWADLLICKTRYSSIVNQGMRNVVLNFALIIETGIAVIICYTPGMSKFLKTYPLYFVWWLPALPFAVIIFIYDEIRKYFIRKNHDGFFYRETYY